MHYQFITIINSQGFRGFYYITNLRELDKFMLYSIWLFLTPLRRYIRSYFEKKHVRSSKKSLTGIFSSSFASSTRVTKHSPREKMEMCS
jgi:hypothetical protein